jgi:hypothetical protein
VLNLLAAAAEWGLRTWQLWQRPCLSRCWHALCCHYCPPIAVVCQCA